MREEEFNKLILSTIANLGGVNVLVDDVAEKVIPGCDSMSKDDIIFYIHDMVKLNKGIHYGVSPSNDVTVSINSKKPVQLPPNQNPHKKI